MSAPDSPATGRDLDAALSEAHDRAEAQIARADAKAAHLITVISTVLTGLGLAAGLVPLPVPAVLVGGLGTAVLMAAAGPLLWVIRPRLPHTSDICRWARLTPKQLLQEVRDDHRAVEVVQLSRIAVIKHRHIHRAVNLLATAGCLLGLAVLIATAMALAAAAR